MHLFLHRIILFVGRSLLDQLYLCTYFNEVTQLSAIPSRVDDYGGARELCHSNYARHLLLSTCKFVTEGGDEGGGVLELVVKWIELKNHHDRICGSTATLCRWLVGGWRVNGWLDGGGHYWTIIL